jgi:hypothetical protein
MLTTIAFAVNNFKSSLFINKAVVYLIKQVSLHAQATDT